MTVFENLNSLNVNGHTEKKGNLTYLSWAWAWAEVKKIYPEAQYTIIKFDGGKPYLYDPDKGCMVFTNVTIEGQTYEMWLPVMDYRNNAIKEPTVMDINKTIMRCLVKNLAMFGLGLYIYAGEDLPETEQEQTPQYISDKAVKTLNGLMKQKQAINKDKTAEFYDWLKKSYNIASFKDLTGEHYQEVTDAIIAFDPNSNE
jgi:hypothetical protein